MLQGSGLDRPGLLHQLTSTLSNLNVDIASAHIATFGEKTVDVFYRKVLADGSRLRPGRLGQHAVWWLFSASVALSNMGPEATWVFIHLRRA